MSGVRTNPGCTRRDIAGIIGRRRPGWICAVTAIAAKHAHVELAIDVKKGVDESTKTIDDTAVALGAVGLLWVRKRRR